MSDFWRGKRVLLTGHTGFKGSWMALVLEQLGAKVTGFALPPDTEPNLYSLLSPWNALQSHTGDVCTAIFGGIITAAKPDIVIHMAAQPLVRRSYGKPVYTIETNVMGTVYLLEALRCAENLQAALIVTSDKVYDNREAKEAFTEEAPLGGSDPYSASKAAAEILTQSFAKSFFEARSIPVATARAGNVIGGGDWSEDRLIPDLWRAYISGTPVTLRYPEAVRPWQHVLDPTFGYLAYAEKLATEKNIPLALNFGPADKKVRTVRVVAEQFAATLGAKNIWQPAKETPEFRESGYLAIDASLAKKTLGWSGRLEADEALRWSADWYKAYRDKQDMRAFSLQQIECYIGLGA